MRGYDEWLISPFEQQEAEWERFSLFCEQNNLDPDDPNSETLYEDAMVDAYDYDFEEQESWDGWDE